MYKCEIQEIMGKIRLKVGIITASMVVKLEYEGRSKSQKQGIEYL